jgi:hypothetical protein
MAALESLPLDVDRFGAALGEPGVEDAGMVTVVDFAAGAPAASALAPAGAASAIIATAAMSAQALRRVGVLVRVIALPC